MQSFTLASGGKSTKNQPRKAKKNKCGKKNANSKIKERNNNLSINIRNGPSNQANQNQWRQMKNNIKNLNRNGINRPQQRHQRLSCRRTQPRHRQTSKNGSSDDSNRFFLRCIGKKVDRDQPPNP